MANVLSSSKPRMARKAAPASGTGRLVDEPAGQAEAAAKLRTGSELLTKAASAFVGTALAGKARGNAGDFRKAYLSIVRSFPKTHRLALLKTMRQSIDEVAEEEQLSTVAPVGKARGKRVSTTDFMAGLEQQELAQRALDLKLDSLLPGSEMRQRLHISAQALSAALKKKRVFALLGPSGDYVYPAFFADPALDRRVLERVSQALGDLPGASKWDFFTSARMSLGGKTPLQALAKGKVEAVLDAANAFREE